jgi:hypothetical protein
MSLIRTANPPDRSFLGRIGMIIGMLFFVVLLPSPSTTPSSKAVERRGGGEEGDVRWRQRGQRSPCEKKKDVEREAGEGSLEAVGSCDGVDRVQKNVGTEAGQLWTSRRVSNRS